MSLGMLTSVVHQPDETSGGAAGAQEPKQDPESIGQPSADSRTPQLGQEEQVALKEFFKFLKVAGPNDRAAATGHKGEPCEKLLSLELKKQLTASSQKCYC